MELKKSALMSQQIEHFEVRHWLSNLVKESAKVRLLKVGRLLNPPFLITVALLTFTGCNSALQDDLGTYSDPKIAVVETQKILTLLSKNINKGYTSVHYINEYEITRNRIFNLD